MTSVYTVQLPPRRVYMWPVLQLDSRQTPPKGFQIITVAVPHYIVKNDIAYRANPRAKRFDCFLYNAQGDAWISETLYKRLILETTFQDVLNNMLNSMRGVKCAVVDWPCQAGCQKGKHCVAYLLQAWVPTFE